MLARPGGPASQWAKQRHKVDTRWAQTGHKVDASWTQGGHKWTPGGPATCLSCSNQTLDQTLLRPKAPLEILPRTSWRHQCKDRVDRRARMCRKWRAHSLGHTEVAGGRALPAPCQELPADPSADQPVSRHCHDMPSAKGAQPYQRWGLVHELDPHLVRLATRTPCPQQLGLGTS